MPRKRKKQVIDLEAKSRAGKIGGPRTKRKMLKKDPEYYRTISLMRKKFSGGRKKKKKRRVAVTA